MKKYKGFTLIELMVVVAIIAILAFLASALFRTAQQNARNSRRTSDLKAIQKVLEQNYDALTNKYPALISLTSEFAGGVIPKDPFGESYSVVDAPAGTGTYKYVAGSWEGDSDPFSVTQEQGY